MTVSKRGTATPKTKHAGAVFVLCHQAWRAGVLDDFFYGDRKLSLGATEANTELVWDLTIEGVHLVFDQKDLDGVRACVEEAARHAGIVAMAWGDTWVGYRQLVVETVHGLVTV